MPRRLFNTLCALSLLAFVAITVLAARSFQAGDAVVMQWDLRSGRFRGIVKRYCVYMNYHGNFLVHYQAEVPIRSHHREPGQTVWWSYHPLHPDLAQGVSDQITADAGEDSMLGIRSRRTGPPDEFALQIPHHMAAAPFLILPAAWLVQHRRRRRRTRLNCCTTCGYDLRASAGRCPECGTPMPTMPGQPHNPAPVLSYEDRHKAPRGFWNAGNVSFAIGASLVITMPIALPAMAFGAVDTSASAQLGKLTLFALWLVGPAIGLVAGVLGLVRRTGRSALLGLGLNVLAWVLLTALCASLARG